MSRSAFSSIYASSYSADVLIGVILPGTDVCCNRWTDCANCRSLSLLAVVALVVVAIVIPLVLVVAVALAVMLAIDVRDAIAVVLVIVLWDYRVED